jgi:hypothetical protein
MADIIYTRNQHFKPDFSNLARVLSGRIPMRPTLFEFAMNDRIVGRLSGAEHVDPSDRLAPLRRQIRRNYEASLALRNSPSWHYRNIIDLGTDVSAGKFVAAVKDHAGAIVGLSALLTTTMLMMEPIVAELRKNNPATKIFIGGAPVSQAFCDHIGADGYFTDPYSFARSFGNV